MTSREKKQILLHFGEIDKHIGELQAEVNAWWAKACSAPSPKLSDMPKSEASGSRTERTVERIARIQEDIENEIDELLVLKHRIMSAIKALPDIRERRVLYLAYIGKTDSGGYRRLKLWQIAQEMNYSVDHINRLHGQALKHLTL